MVSTVVSMSLAEAPTREDIPLLSNVRGQRRRAATVLGETTIIDLPRKKQFKNFKVSWGFVPVETLIQILETYLSDMFEHYTIIAGF